MQVQPRSADEEPVAARAEAAFRLGLLLNEQLDRPDVAGARDAFVRAAADGHAEAAFKLGLLLRDQLDPPDVDGARDAFERAAAAGHRQAAVNLRLLGHREPNPFRAAVERVRKQPIFAWLLVAAWAGGAALVAWHWAITPWAVRASEFSGRVGAGVSGHDLLEAAGDWRPYPGLVLLASGALLGSVVFAGTMCRRLSAAAAWTLLLLVIPHIAEWLLLTRVAHAPQQTAYLLALQGVAFVGYGLLPPAAVLASIGGMTAVVRLVTMPTRKTDTEPHPAPPGVDPVGNADHWLESSQLPQDMKHPPSRGRRRGGLGISLSGGGIRSATFTLGALQALQRQPDDHPCQQSELRRARYLTSVSGGSYTAGALLLALQRDVDTDPPERRDHDRDPRLTCDDALRPGSPEFDHLRKHSSYIADGLREWLGAIFVIIRGALIATFLLALVTLVLGRWAGYFYHQVGQAGALRSAWFPLWGAVFATAVLTVVALVSWYLSSTPSAVRTGEAHPLRYKILIELAFVNGVAVAILVALGAVIPAIAALSQHVVDASAMKGNDAVSGAAGGGLLGVAGIVMTALGLINKQRIRVQQSVKRIAEPEGKHLGDTGHRIVQWVPVVFGLLLVIAVYAVFFGYVAASAAAEVPGDPVKMRWGTPQFQLPSLLDHLGLTIALTLLLALVYLAVDETTTGLHPFYRRRLASAFAVNRTGRSDDSGLHSAVRYHWKRQTRLEEYGDVPPNAGPHVIFCAAAHCSDPAQTPPGRHVLPFTFSGDFVGGPEVGWCRTDEYAEKSPGRLRQDVTVQAAMAVSGAAFASTEGANEVPGNVLLALTNARLGTWTTFPQLASDLSHEAVDWWNPKPPHVRRLSYLVREVFATYPFRPFPLLFVTDGAHYETLGLLELLRHRCDEIYCFDATSDADAWAAALAHAIALAYDELGVRINLDNPDRARPGADGTAASNGAKGAATTPSEPAELASGLSRTPLITGEIIYPALSDELRESRAILVIGRAELDAEAPWELRRHKEAHPTFPHDATGDQWFDDAKFNAYTQLGRYVGDQARVAMAARRRNQAQQREAQPTDGVRAAVR